MRISEVESTPHKIKISTELDSLEREKSELQSEYAKISNEWFWAQKDTEKRLELRNQLNAINQKLKSLHDKMLAVIAQQPFQAAQILKKIEQECSQILALNKKTHKFLLSGMKDRGAAFQGETQQNRPPKDSDPEPSQKFDDYLKRLNFKALRSNSIFVTTDVEQAEMYGDIYLIFPRDNQFSYTYTKHKDIVLDQTSDENLETLTTFLAAYSPMAQQLDLAMDKGVEILIHGKYIALKGEIFGEWVSKLWGIDYLEQIQ